MSGDVVVLDFPFSDVVMKKRRPALVLRVVRDNLIIVPITSNLLRSRCGVLLVASDFLEGGLRTESVVRTDFLVTSSAELVLYRVGRLSADKHRVIVTAICAILRGD